MKRSATILTRCRLAAVLIFMLFFAVEGTLFAQIRITRGPYVQSGRTDGMIIVWYTDLPSDSCVHYSRNQFSWRTKCDPSQVTRHEVTLTGLQPATTYWYVVASNRLNLRRDDNKLLFRFQTNKSGEAPFRFVAFGDCATGMWQQAAVVNRILALDPKPDFAVLTGDIVYDVGADADYPLKFFQPYKDLIDSMVFYPAIGNHDNYTDNGQPYLNVFSLPRNGPEGITPERNYTFDYGNTRFLTVDTNASADVLRNTIGPWVVRNLAHAPKRWKIVYFHHAPYSSGPNSEGQDVAGVREVLPPILSAQGVDLVLNGHDHLYERTKPINGVTYIVTGAGGHNVLYPKQYNRAYSDLFYGGGNGRHSFTHVDVSGNRLTLKQIDTAGCQVDTLVMEKPIAEFDVWNYWKGSTFPGNGWKNPSFDDSNWPSGPAGFGYGGNYNSATVLDDMQNHYISVYTRKTFQVPDASKIKNLKLRVYYDDSFVAYINGVEVARANVPQDQTHTTPAASVHKAIAYETFDINPSVLANGTNLIAVEGHNWALYSSDLALVVELTTSYTEPSHCP
jgi:hypothetical protein